MKYLDLYYYYLVNGMPSKGLCDVLSRDLIADTQGIEHFEKFQNEAIKYFGGHSSTPGYWADGNEDTTFPGAGYRIDNARTFTPLRQTIILLCAAMNNEL